MLVLGSACYSDSEAAKWRKVTPQTDTVKSQLNIWQKTWWSWSLTEAPGDLSDANINLFIQIAE